MPIKSITQMALLVASRLHMTIIRVKHTSSVIKNNSK